MFGHSKTVFKHYMAMAGVPVNDPDVAAEMDSIFEDIESGIKYAVRNRDVLIRTKAGLLSQIEDELEDELKEQDLTGKKLLDIVIERLSENGIDIIDENIILKR
jgi:hypothetical protein